MTRKTWEVAEVYAAARERLRLSRQPCEVCQGSGEYWVPFDDGHGGGFPHPDKCPACNGSGEVWPAELVDRAAKAVFLGLMRPQDVIDDESWVQFERGRSTWELHARSVLDAVESWLRAGKGSDE